MDTAHFFCSGLGDQVYQRGREREEVRDGVGLLPVGGVGLLPVGGVEGDISVGVSDVLFLTVSPHSTHIHHTYTPYIHTTTHKLHTPHTTHTHHTYTPPHIHSTLHTPHTTHKHTHTLYTRTLAAAAAALREDQTRVTPRATPTRTSSRRRRRPDPVLLDRRSSRSRC